MDRRSKPGETRARNRGRRARSGRRARHPPHRLPGSRPQRSPEWGMHRARREAMKRAEASRAREFPAARRRSAAAGACALRPPPQTSLLHDLHTIAKIACVPSRLPAAQIRRSSRTTPTAARRAAMARLRGASACGPSFATFAPDRAVRRTTEQARRSREQERTRRQLRIAYLSYSPLRAGVANAVHVMNMCSAFSRNGHETALFARGSGGRRAAPEIFSKYGVSDAFELRLRPSLRVKLVGRLYY